MQSELENSNQLGYGLKELLPGQSSLEIFHIYKFHERDEIRAAYFSIFTKIKNTHHFYILVDMTCVFEYKENYKYTLVYHLLNPEKDQRLKVKVHLNQQDKMISLHEVWPCLLSLEKEVHRKYGVCFFMGRGKQDLEPIDNASMLSKVDLNTFDEDTKKEDFIKYRVPLRPSPFEARLKWSSVDVNSFPFEGLGRLDLFWDKKTQVVKKAFLNNSLYERFIEKKAEQSNVFDIQLLTMRSSTQNSIFYSLLYNEIIEELAGIKVPDRASAIRMILVELSRISSHLNYLRKFIALSGFQYEGEHIRELSVNVLKLLGSYHNRSYTFSPFVVGGVFCDMSSHFVNDYISINDQANDILSELKRNLYRNRTFMKESLGSKLLPAFAIGEGVTGPALRSCGVKYDLRKANRDYFYNDLDFEVPLGIDGTSYDRFLVHIEESLQSFHIINQIINFIPSGQIVNNDHLYFNLSDSDDVPNLPVGEVYKSIEGPEGEMAIYYLSDGESHTKRFHFRSPSHFNKNLFHNSVDTISLPETLLTLQSLNLDSWELDL